MNKSRLLLGAAFKGLAGKLHKVGIQLEAERIDDLNTNNNVDSEDPFVTTQLDDMHGGARYLCICQRCGGSYDSCSVPDSLNTKVWKRDHLKKHTDNAHMVPKTKERPEQIAFEATSHNRLSHEFNRRFSLLLESREDWRDKQAATESKQYYLIGELQKDFTAFRDEEVKRTNERHSQLSALRMKINKIVRDMDHLRAQNIEMAASVKALTEKKNKKNPPKSRSKAKKKKR